MSNTHAIDRNGACPHCCHSWDGQDIFESLNMMDVHAASKSQADVAKLAIQFGWTPDNGKKFSKVIVYEMFSETGKDIFYQCPKCQHVYNSITGEHFNSIYEVRNRNKKAEEVLCD